MNRDMLSRRLARRGFEVAIAIDGAQGVELTRASRPDLILMDMSLPVLDGWEATRRLKADPSTQRMPVIALTAHAMSSDRASKPAATTTTPSPSNCPACWPRSRRCSGRQRRQRRPSEA